MNSTSPLDPTYYGFIGSTYDALILFEACITGQIRHVPRRPHDTERERVIQSGSIFIYEENRSGIKRWTDGVSWSPSRILGNFLIYRQLSKAFGPGEKKKAIKKPRASPNVVNKSNSDDYSRNKENIFQLANSVQYTGGTCDRVDKIKIETERSLIGSLTDSYDFLREGLVKKTISINYGDSKHHLVSYYTISDARSQTFIMPSKDPRLAGTNPRISLLSSQKFRNGIEDIDPLDLPNCPRNKYGMTQQSFLQRHNLEIPAPEGDSSNFGAINKLNSSNHNTAIVSIAYEHDLTAYQPTVGIENLGVNVLSNYPEPQGPERLEGAYKQNFDVAGSWSSEDNRLWIARAGNMKRGVSVYNRRNSEDSSISMFMDKMIDDSNFNHNRNSCYGLPRNSVLGTNSIPVQKTLPSLSLADFTYRMEYDGLLPNGQKRPYTMSLNSADMWQFGNVSAGHGHY